MHHIKHSLKCQLSPCPSSQAESLSRLGLGLRDEEVTDISGYIKQSCKRRRRKNMGIISAFFFGYIIQQVFVWPLFSHKQEKM